MNQTTMTQLLELVRNNYEDIAWDFSQTRNYIWPALKNIVTTQLKQLQTTKNQLQVLDLGCGNGRLFELCQKDNKIIYTGVDQSKNLIDIAQARYAQAKFYHANVLDFTKDCTQKFDLVLLIAVLQHIPSHDLRLNLLQQLKQCLHPGGIIIMTNWNLKQQSKYKKIIYKYNLLKLLGKNNMDFNDIVFNGFNKKSLRYYHAFSKKELYRLCKQAQLNISQIYSDKHNIYTICKN